MAKGNKNPSPATRFGAGESGNPQGKTSKQRQMEIENARLATEIRGRLLKAVSAVVKKTPNEQVLAQVEAGVLKLLKDAEDRGLGAPKASVDISNPDGSLQQRPTQEAVIGALLNIHAPSPSKRR